MVRSSGGGLKAVALAAFLAACSRDLSKGNAKEMLAKRYEERPTLYCALKNGVLEEKPGIFSAGLNDDQSVSQLRDIGALVSVGCIKEYSAGGCMTYGFATGSKAVVERGHDFFVECGSRTLGDVTSVTTEGKKAKVRFTETFKLDDTKSRLSACILRPIEAGQNDGSATFVQDDSGNWTKQ